MMMLKVMMFNPLVSPKSGPINFKFLLTILNQKKSYENFILLIRFINSINKKISKGKLLLTTNSPN